jgi:hypothetical protein
VRSTDNLTAICEPIYLYNVGSVTSHNPPRSVTGIDFNTTTTTTAATASATSAVTTVTAFFILFVSLQFFFLTRVQLVIGC